MLRRKRARAPEISTRIGLHHVFLAFLLALSVGANRTVTLAASASPALIKTKADAERRGYLFETSHDDILAKAKKEGKLRVLSTIEPAALKALRDAFKKKYPLIDVRVQELGSVEENQRFLLELKAGTAARKSPG